jgi:hypothetical protein
MSAKDQPSFDIYISHSENKYTVRVLDYHGRLFEKEMSTESAAEAFINQISSFIKSNHNKVTYDNKKDLANLAKFTIMIMKWAAGHGVSMPNKDKILSKNYKTLEKFGKYIGITDPQSVK